MKKLTLITSTLLVVLSFCSYAQDKKTPYTEKKEALRFKLFSDLDFPLSLVSSTSNVGEFFDAFMYKVKDERGIALLVKYQQDLKAAESLKNPSEIRKPLGKGEPTPEQMLALSEGYNPKPTITPEDNTVYSFVSMENPPSFPGGIERFYKFIDDNKKYPAMAIENNIQGNVFVSFTVEKDGSLTDIKIDRKLGHGTDEEAVRVLKLSKRWNPGMQNGKPVRVKYNIPIKFSLPQ